jgi:hypothetical protein
MRKKRKRKERVRVYETEKRKWYQMSCRKFDENWLSNTLKSCIDFKSKFCWTWFHFMKIDSIRQIERNCIELCIICTGIKPLYNSSINWKYWNHIIEIEFSFCIWKILWSLEETCKILWYRIQILFCDILFLSFNSSLWLLLFLFRFRFHSFFESSDFIFEPSTMIDVSYLKDLNQITWRNWEKFLSVDVMFQKFILYNSSNKNCQ